MNSLEADLERARSLSVSELADAIESIGFECTHCGACCKATACDDSPPGDEASTDDHTATVFPGEVRRLQERDEYDWRDVARPMPYGLSETSDGQVGQTFEWALQTDSCGDCVFYEEFSGDDRTDDGHAGGRCTVYGDRPLICRTYPFSIALDGTTQPVGEAVDREGLVRAHECEGLGRAIDRETAESLATTLKERAVRELEEAIAVRENYDSIDAETEVVVYDSEGPKRLDGRPW